MPFLDFFVRFVYLGVRYMADKSLDAVANAGAMRFPSLNRNTILVYGVFAAAFSAAIALAFNKDIANALAEAWRTKFEALTGTDNDGGNGEKDGSCLTPGCPNDAAPHKGGFCYGCAEGKE